MIFPTQLIDDIFIKLIVPKYIFIIHDLLILHSTYFPSRNKNDDERWRVYILVVWWRELGTNKPNTKTAYRNQ